MLFVMPNMPVTLIFGFMSILPPVHGVCKLRDFADPQFSVVCNVRNFVSNRKILDKQLKSSSLVSKNQKRQ